MKLLLLLLNSVILVFNIFIWFYKVKKANSFYLFKNSDNFTFFSSSKLYKKIYKDCNSNKNKIFRISINFVDFLNNSHSFNYLKYLFKKQSNFIFENNTENPDFLVYNMWGTEHLNIKYNNSIKIAKYSENYIPDLNQADYALGNSHIMYLDRYFKYPYFIPILNKYKRYDIEQIRKDAIKKKKNKFCAAVISSNKTSEYFRFNFINELNKYKKIDMGGRAFNNVGGRVKDKIKFLSSYKFSFAMENSQGDGYVSEKIIDSFMAGTIPIYYGGYLIDEFINPKSFILVKGEKDMKNKIEYIKKIDNDEELYQSILRENIFNENFKNLTENTFEEKIKFFKNIFIQEKMNAKRADKTNFYLNCFTCED